MPRTQALVLQAYPVKLRRTQRKFRHETLERVPIKWNHLIDKDSLKIKVLEHVLIEKVEQFFRDMLQPHP